MNDWVKGVQF